MFQKNQTSHSTSIKTHQSHTLIYPAMDTMDPYSWIELDDPRRFLIDRQILESAVDLSQSCLKCALKIEFFDLLEKYKDAFSLRDDIGLAPHMEVHLDLTDKTFYSERRYEKQNRQKMD